jgi:hypothetical protein
MRLAIRQHLFCLNLLSTEADVVYFNAVHGIPRCLSYFRPDIIVLHTTLLCTRSSPLFYALKWEAKWIEQCDALKIAIPQDEYDHSEILDEWLYEWGVQNILTVFDESVRALIYPLMHARAHFVQCLTGYIDPAAAHRYQAKLRPTDERPFDLVYRATRLPSWFGRHGKLKHQIAELALARAAKLGLVTDISTRPEDAILGERWLDFLASGRAVLGCESGSSALDRRGEIRSAIRQLLELHPTSDFEHLDRCLPSGWDSHRFFALSPRHLEAAVTRTCQLLVEGSYSGILRPNEHYIPIKKDFSNLDEALEMVQDGPLVRRIARQAYEQVVLSSRFSYHALAHEFSILFRQGLRKRNGYTLPWPLARIAAWFSRVRLGPEAWLWKKLRGNLSHLAQEP